MSDYIYRSTIIAAILIAGFVRSNGQNALPEVFTQGTIAEQLRYMDEHTRIYADYRAIREDMYQVFGRNTSDTLLKTKEKINGLVLQATALKKEIDSLNNNLEASNDKLVRATRTKDSIRVLGMDVNKTAYNAVMWTVLAVLLFLLVIGYLSFMRNRTVTLRTRKDLEELKEEFEAYRQKIRIERERTNFEHFNEIKKLKAQGPR
jgi:hypothetical protein